ncbi:MAG: cobalt ABC transporter ATP-binding protein [Deltaproteobacteria bacterium RBG_13_61_14]|nr:MAG: cobalt ABC transporter ATP-binding protein [Deltaproteobacteria bacterium RBG_13_61_14]
MTLTPAVSIRDLSYTYPDGTFALDSVSLELKPGEVLGLVGPNGAGKSTLLLHLNGMLRANGGAVQVMGIPVKPKNYREVRRRVGLVFQNPDDQLFCPTLFEDVAFGPRNLGLQEAEVTARVRASLAAVGLQGLDNKSAHHLSFGQKRRAAIATVLAMQPDVLALDEPTSNLDPRGKRLITELIASFHHARIIVTHDLDLARTLCPRVAVMAQGRVIAEGNPQELFSDHDLLDQAGLR